MKKEDVPLRTAYSQAGRLWQPKPRSLRAQAQLMRTETVETFELVKVEPKLLREEKGERESCRPSGIKGIKVSDAVPKGLGLNPGEDMDVFICTVPSRHEGTLNSRRAASHLVRLMAGDERSYVKAVTPKCLRGPPVDRDRLNTHPGSM
ncbi:hypothetical protein TNCV_4943191 [Trichonephila clavipes]|nr:hypothetical protein TNCV_4943191 [Trichonephila clavipes]